MAKLSFQEEMARLNGTAPEAMSELDAATARKAAPKRAKRKKKVKKVNMAGNPYFDVIANEPNQLKQQEKFVELMTFTDTATAKANEKALLEYTTWMQEQRQEMSSELITLNDTGTFSNLQLVLKDINGDLLDFEDRIKPFLDIINSVRTLQEKDLITDTIAEIAAQAERVEEIEKKLHANLVAINNIKFDIGDKEGDVAYINREIERLEGERSWFGFGDTTPNAKRRIGKKEGEITKLMDALITLKNKEATLEAQRNTLRKELEEATNFGELAKEKQILADMLNLNSDEHGAKHSELISSATKFVNTTKERVGETLDKSLGLSDHIGKLSDLSYNIRGRYSVISAAATEAEKNNSELHAKLKEAAEAIDDSDQLGKLMNEEEQRDLAKYINGLNDSVADTAMVLTDMTVASQRIETMQHANTAQIKKTRSIATSGIAGVADNLSSVLTSIGQTATGQAATAAQQSLRRMNETTINLTKDQMLNQAKDRNDVNADLVRNLENLAGFGEVIELANQNTYEAVAQARDLVSDLRETADNVQDTITEGVEIQSTVITDTI